MAKVQFVLDPAPTFKAKVNLPVHGGDAVPVEFTFKHRSKEQMHAFGEEVKTLSEVDAVLAMCEGWELTDEFSAENVQKLVSNYQGSYGAIVSKYAIELIQARQGN